MTANNFSGFGFAVGSVTGYRSFFVDQLCRLRAVYSNFVWAPGELVATCNVMEEQQRLIEQGWVPVAGGTLKYDPGQQQQSTSPYAWGNTSNMTLTFRQLAGRGEEVEEHRCQGMGEACKMGFYGYWSQEHNTYRGRGTVEGVVEAYGKVVIGNLGFRAEKARLVAFTIPEPGKKGNVKGKEFSTQSYERLRRNYEGSAAIYRSVDEMLAAHPPTSYLVTPKDSPDFWTRKV